MTVKIKVSGPIISNDEKWIYDWFEWDGTCPNDVINALPDNGEEVEVTINSYGGYLDEGNEIYTELMNYPGRVKINVIMAGSAASIIAMAGNPVRISPVGQIMIHNASMYAGGDYHDMDKASEILQKTNESVANAYILKTGLGKEELLEKMDEETWLTAEESVDLGFADEIMFKLEGTERPAMVADGGSVMIPKNIVEKVKELKNSKKELVANVNVDAEKVAEMVLEKLSNAIADDEKLQIEEPKENEMKNESPFARYLF